MSWLVGVWEVFLLLLERGGVNFVVAADTLARKVIGGRELDDENLC